MSQSAKKHRGENMTKNAPATREQVHEADEIHTRGQLMQAAGTNLPADPALLAEMESYAGQGVSTAAEDNIVPLLYILQALSPQVIPRNAKQIPGACQGDFWFKDSGIPPINGESGIIVQPCYFSKPWLEWLPNRQGFAGRHADMPQDAVEKEYADEQGDIRKAFFRPNGNLVEERREHYILVEGRPFVLSLKGSGHTRSRIWMGMMNGFKLPSGKPAPSFSRKYRLTTEPASDNKGHNWFALKVEDAGPVTLAELKAGAELYNACASGAKVAAVDDDIETKETIDSEVI